MYPTVSSDSKNMTVGEVPLALSRPSRKGAMNHKLNTFHNNSRIKVYSKQSQRTNFTETHREKIMPPMDGRPPLAVSPRRLRPRCNLRSVLSDQAPPASIRTKPNTPVRSSLPSDQLLRPGYSLISSELMEMAKRAKDGFSSDEFEDMGTGVNAATGFKTSPLFERGRFYELYSARRNERLKRKQMEFEADETVAQDPGIAVELAKRRTAKKAESLRKSVPANLSVSRTSSLRSSVRSSKEIKKAAVAASCERKPAADLGRRIGTRSVRRI